MERVDKDTYRTSSAENGTVKMSYNQIGQLEWRQDARGAIEELEYGTDSSLVSSTFTLGSDVETVTFSYENGRRTEAIAVGIDGEQVIEHWEYERRGLVREHERILPGRQPFVVAFTYDEDGGLVEQRVASDPWAGCASVRYKRDFAGRPVRISGSSADCSKQSIIFADSIEYLPFGPVQRITGPSYGETFGYNQRYRLTYQEVATQSAGVVLQRGYGYDDIGHLTSVTNHLDSLRDHSYTYNEMYRLSAATGPFGSLTYTYDQLGNRTERQSQAGVQQLAYSPGTSIIDSVVETPVGQPSEIRYLLHDTAGNLTDDEQSYFSYSPRNKLLEQGDSFSSQPELRFVYDAEGLRVSSEQAGGGSGKVLHYLIGGATPMVDRTLDENGAPETDRFFVFFGDRLLATFDESGTVRQVVTDLIGYPQLVLDGNGDVVWEAEAQPFGGISSVVQGSASEDPLARYLGQSALNPQQFIASTELVYNNHRWYNPAWGRYTQTDPVDVIAPRSYYAYAALKPKVLADKLGLECGPWVLERKLSLPVDPPLGDGYESWDWPFQISFSDRFSSLSLYGMVDITVGDSVKLFKECCKPVLEMRSYDVIWTKECGCGDPFVSNPSHPSASLMDGLNSYPPMNDFEWHYVNKEVRDRNFCCKKIIITAWGKTYANDWSEHCWDVFGLQTCDDFFNQ